MLAVVLVLVLVLVVVVDVVLGVKQVTSITIGEEAEQGDVHPCAIKDLVRLAYNIAHVVGAAAITFPIANK